MKKAIITMAILSVIIMIFTACSSAIDEPVKMTKPTEEISQSDTIMLSLKNAMPKMPKNAQNIQLGFNLDVLKQLSKQNGNVFFSSMSINQALTMAYFGANGTTQKEIANILGYAGMSIEDVASYQKQLLETYKNSGDTTFNNANSVWIDNEFTAKDSYIDTMNDVFDTEVENIDLQNPNTIDKLNSWIDDKTNHMIKKLFEKDENPLSNSIMVLMNAIYFKGEWTIPFNPDRTFPAIFNGASSQSEIDMMSSDEDVLGFESDNYKAISLQYGDDERFSMVVVLPNEDTNTFTDGLTTDSLNDILTTFEEKREVIIQLPKFEMEEEVELSNVLKSLGMITAFSDNADFNRISDTPIMINEVLHKAKIKVDEEGTEVAAVTAIILNRTSMPVDQFEFIADRPFLFFIIDTANDLVLFSGRVNDLV